MIEHLTERIALANTTTDPAGTALAWMTGITGIVVAVIGLALIVLLIAAVISALIDDNTTAGGKLLWVIFILWFPFFGAIAWFVVGKKGYLNRILGIDKGKVRHTSPPSVGHHSDIRDSGPIPRPGGERDPGQGHYPTGPQQPSGRV
ncbi:PLD nuclease N-terminal domain-containing protein [Nocardiopsis protaetiae]|uniref:PLD nuclease N-terminal domain-containing protein n=1 Tax=Nocardiopsis protaetiae TaxID=3382270 RepID=UPI00387AE30D